MRSPSLLWSAAQAAQGGAPAGPDPVGSGLRSASTNTPGAAGTVTITDYVVPAVTNGVLLVAAWAGDFLNTPDLTGVTFGGSAMTAVAAPVLHNPQSDFNIDCAFYYVINPSGTGNIVVSGTASGGTDLNEMAVIARTYANVKQSAPNAALLSNTSAGGASISSTLTSVPANALAVDAFFSRTASTTASEARQNVYLNTPIPNGLRYFGGSDDLNTSAGNVTFGWEEAAGNWFTHLMIALEKA